MTVLFCDLRGFTALSENLSPATVRMMLNHYYDRVTDIVLAMDGTLMKYVGDEVFAVWGAPLPEHDHPQMALECAIAIQALTPRAQPGAARAGRARGVVRHRAEHRAKRWRRTSAAVAAASTTSSATPSTSVRGSARPRAAVRSSCRTQVLTRVPSPPPVEPVGRSSSRASAASCDSGESCPGVG